MLVYAICLRFSWRFFDSPEALLHVLKESHIPYDRKLAKLLPTIGTGVLNIGSGLCVHKLPVERLP